MKLNELFETVDWNSKSEKQQIAAIKRSYNVFSQIKNPSEAVQLAAVKEYAYNIIHLLDNNIIPSEDVQLTTIQHSLSNITMVEIIRVFTRYNVKLSANVILAILHHNKYNHSNKIKFIKEYFANNSLLIAKWLRYLENIQEK